MICQRSPKAAAALSPSAHRRECGSDSKTAGTAAPARHRRASDRCTRWHRGARRHRHAPAGTTRRTGDDSERR